MTVFVAVAIVVIYCALFYVAGGPEQSGTRPAAAISGRVILYNVAAALFLFFLIDGVVFHTGLYESLLEPRSHAGRVVALLRSERQTPLNGGKQILVLGDSRMGIGFSEEVANEMANREGITFLNRSMPGSVPRLWYYLLREIDPALDRYQAIVLPLKIDAVDPRSVSMHISQAAPLLRYGDAGAFAAGFGDWSSRCRAFTACLLRGSAYQTDIFDLFEHPLRRVDHLRHPQFERAKFDDFNIAGIEFDPTTKKMKFPKHLTKRQRKSIQRSAKIVRSARCSGECYAWTKRIADKYDASSTSIMVVPLPRGPLGSDIEQTSAVDATGESLRTQKVVMLDPTQFGFLEQPDYYVDGFHFNRKGQEHFTRVLTTEVLARLGRSNHNQAQARVDAPPVEE